MRIHFLVACLFTMNACGPAIARMGAVPLTEAGSRVTTSPNAPPRGCTNRGAVVGETRGASTTAAGEHIRRAVDDARNRAAALGANYVQTTDPQLTQSEWGPTGATVMGTAFYCVSDTEGGEGVAPPASPTAQPASPPTAPTAASTTQPGSPSSYPPPASPIVSSSNPPTGVCENKGTVIGESRGASTTGAAEHTRRALADAIGQAGARGANYLQTTSPQLRQAKFGVTGATVMGTAFFCKPAAASAQ
jgi:hypothetical protein